MCTVTLNEPTVGLSVVAIASNNANLTAPSGLVITTGTTGSFTASAAKAIASNQTATLTVTLNSVAAMTSISLTAPTSDNTQAQLAQISCTPKSLTARARGTCSITLDHVEKSTTAVVQLSSSSASLRLPEKVVTRPGQSTVEFQVDAVSSGEGIVVAANLGPDTVKETLAVTPDRSTPIHVPGPRFVKYGTEVRFQVSPSDSAATLSAGALPAGAHFDSSTGEFGWTPDGTQLGAHDINFTAIDSAGGKASASVTVQVDSGEPVVTRIVNAATRSRDLACSPGAIAAIEGRWLTDGSAASDPSGNSTELAGTKVWADGIPVPILSASGSELNILCPDSMPGSEIQLVVETGHGVAEPRRTTARSAAPGIFSLDGSGLGQGWILLEGTDNVAMIRNYRVPAQPAVPGERLLLYATGIGNLTNISVQIGEYQALPAAVKAVPNHSGLYQVVVSMPDLGLQKNDLPVSLTGEGPEGIVRTNLVSIAVEANLW
ncbi:MAG: putative Ig domain-containing protein [Verrucomicrobiia bacterium]